MPDMEQALRDHAANDKDAFERFDEKFEKIEGLIRELAAAQQKQVGFIAGVAATVSILVGAIALAFQWFKG